MNDFPAVFARLSAHAPAMARTPAAERRDRLRRLRAAIVARRPDIHAALHADFAKPAAETELSEVHLALEEIDHACRHLPRWMRARRARHPLLLAGTSARIRPEPRGVCLVLAPFNYPFGLVINPLVSAMAAGNCVLVKPSEKTPRTAALLAELLAGACDPDQVAVATGGADVAAALLALPFDHVFFTGSAAVGRIVMAAAARHLASVTLELGGKSPAIVDAGADAAAAADHIVWGKFFNGGQTCIAPDYVCVHASLAHAFLDAARAAVARLYGATEESRQASPDFARVIDDAAFARLRAVIDGSVAAGARIEIGGRYDAATRYVAPTILSNVTPESPAMAGEIFGPVLPVLTYRDLDDVIGLVRAGTAPLMSYIFAPRRSTVARLVADIPAGTTSVNGTMLPYANPYLPFGGIGESGTGATHGEHGFRAFSHLRPVLVQRRPALIRLLFPPYRGRLHALAMRFVRALE